MNKEEIHIITGGNMSQEEDNRFFSKIEIEKINRRNKIFFEESDWRVEHAWKNNILHSKNNYTYETENSERGGVMFGKKLIEDFEKSFEENLLVGEYTRTSDSVDGGRAEAPIYLQGIRIGIMEREEGRRCNNDRWSYHLLPEYGGFFCCGKGTVGGAIEALVWECVKIIPHLKDNITLYNQLQEGDE